MLINFGSGSSGQSSSNDLESTYLKVDTGGDTTIDVIFDSPSSGAAQWGDGSFSSFSGQTTISQAYVSSGQYDVYLIGDTTNFRYNNSPEAAKLIEVRSNRPLSTMDKAFWGATSLVDFDLDTSNVSVFSNAFRGNTSLVDFPFIDTSNATLINLMFYQCTGLKSIPQLNLSKATKADFAWTLNSSLISFPPIDMPLVGDFSFTWFRCSSLTSFPSINVNSGTNFFRSWFGCTSLASFPAGMFDNVSATNFGETWRDCALDQTSVNNILVSINNAGTSNGTLDIDGGTNASPGGSGLAAKQALESRGWTVNVN